MSETALMHKRLAAQNDEFAQLHARERVIFETLVNMGVRDDDPDLNPVHRILLEWYRMDMEKQELEKRHGVQEF